MNRRQFLARSSSGIIFSSLPFGVLSARASYSDKKRIEFEPYRSGKTMGKILKITPDDGFYVHTYYDICPFSPSGKYVLVTKLPFQGKSPVMGDLAKVCLIDLEEQTIRTIYTTKCWGFQVGANAQWGVNDRFVYTNDILTDRAVCVRIDLETGDVLAYDGPKYDIAPDASCVISPSLELMDYTQGGYGAPRNPGKSYRLSPGAASDEGIWKTDLVSKETKLFLSLESASKSLSKPEFYEGGTFYFWHSKFNRQNTRIMQVVRCIFPKDVVDRVPEKMGRNPSVITLDVDGKNIKETVTEKQWEAGGHHPNWHPDGEHIVMNLVPFWLGDSTLRFCKMKYDGSDFSIMSNKYEGSGHPSVDITGKYLLSDAYPHEKFANDGEVPIRLIDLELDHEEHICSVFIDVKGPRCDSHPVWSRDSKKVCFNGAPGGNRQVFIANLEGVL